MDICKCLTFEIFILIGVLDGYNFADPVGFTNFRRRLTVDILDIIRMELITIIFIMAVIIITAGK